MAEQPSITSILAALGKLVHESCKVLADFDSAAQRPTTTPAQQQQPLYQEQPTYQQPAQAHIQPGYPGSAYQLPQPTNSGSVDLSNIKPVSSGTVSIAEAIAKAKAIAAEKG